MLTNLLLDNLRDVVYCDKYVAYYSTAGAALYEDFSEWPR